MQIVLLAMIALGVPLSAIGALYPGNTWLQVGPVAVGLPLAWLALRRWPVSNGAALCLAAFVLLHLFAARWSYSFVPYQDWFGTAHGQAEAGRNMFDRLAHILFGLLAMLPLAEIGRRYWQFGKVAALAVGLLSVLALGGLYEIFEWTLTLSLSPDQAGAYNGEQGDIYDAQKDMAVAALGALIAVPFVWFAQGRKVSG